MSDRTARNIDVPPFEHIGRVSLLALRPLRVQVEEFRNADEACRRDMEGSREEPDVPGWRA